MKRLIAFHAIAFVTERSKTRYNKEIRLKISYCVIARIYTRYSFKFRKRDFFQICRTFVRACACVFSLFFFFPLFLCFCTDESMFRDKFVSCL